MEMNIFRHTSLYSRGMVMIMCVCCFNCVDTSAALQLTKSDNISAAPRKARRSWVHLHRLMHNVPVCEQKNSWVAQLRAVDYEVTLTCMVHWVRWVRFPNKWLEKWIPPCIPPKWTNSPRDHQGTVWNIYISIVTGFVQYLYTLIKIYVLNLFTSQYIFSNYSFIR